jgi:hypothetical protein
VVTSKRDLGETGEGEVEGKRRREKCVRGEDGGEERRVKDEMKMRKRGGGGRVS